VTGQGVCNMSALGDDAVDGPPPVLAATRGADIAVAPIGFEPAAPTVCPPIGSPPPARLAWRMIVFQHHVKPRKAFGGPPSLPTP